MLRKIFAAVVIALLVTTTQIANAIPIDWNQVKRVSNKQELARYIESERVKGKTKIPVVLTNGFTISLNEFAEFYLALRVWQDLVGSDGKNTQMLYTLMEYPGTRVAKAYLSGDTGWLKEEEKQLYDVAVGIVNDAKNRNGILNQEVYIYEQIMNRAEYLTGDMSQYPPPNFLTAIGALVYGKANCQGYADAFYMLGRMMGWNVGRIGGKVGNVSHVWNWIEINGKTYFVDVTQNDSNLQYKNRKRKLNSYIYFNAPAEIMQVTHTWDWSLAPQNLQPSVDENYSYSYLDSNLARRTNAEAGLKLLAQKLSEGKTWFTVMTPYDERYNSFDKASSYFNSLTKSKYWLHVYPFGKKYIFFTVDVFDK